MYLSKLHNQLLVSLFPCFISSHWHESFSFVSFILLAWVLVDFSQVGNMFDFISIVNLQVSISQVFFEHFNKRNGGATVAEELYQVLYIGKKHSWNISRSVLGKVATYRFHLVKSDQRQCLFVCLFKYLCTRQVIEILLGAEWGQQHPVLLRKFSFQVNTFVCLLVVFFICFFMRTMMIIAGPGLLASFFCARYLLLPSSLFDSFLTFFPCFCLFVWWILVAGPCPPVGSTVCNHSSAPANRRATHFHPKNLDEN